MDANAAKLLWEHAGNVTIEADFAAFRVECESVLGELDPEDPETAREVSDIRYFLTRQDPERLDDRITLIQGRLALIRVSLMFATPKQRRATRPGG